MLAFTREDILGQLDRHVADFTFPMLDNGYSFLVDTRLTAWRGDQRWALAIETVGYSPRAGRMDICIHRFGNCVDGPTGTRNEDFIDPVSGEVEDLANPEHALPGLKSLVLRGHEVPLVQHADPWPLEAMYRSLTPTWRDHLFATEQELMAYFPSDLDQVLRLHEWHHPDLLRQELPSGNEAFGMIADVLCSGDKSRYAPTRSPNTHWTNWPEGGSL